MVSLTWRMHSTASHTVVPSLVPSSWRLCTSPTKGICPVCSSQADRLISIIQEPCWIAKVKGLNMSFTSSLLLCDSCSLLKYMFQLLRTLLSAAHDRMVVMFSGMSGSTQFCSTRVIVRVSTALSQPWTTSQTVLLRLTPISHAMITNMKPVERCRTSDPTARTLSPVSSVRVMEFTKVLASSGSRKTSPKSPWMSRWSCWPRRYHSRSWRSIDE
mmetsp:Transcript_3628/g.10317  ORF Transcript_3628/g.10317 Transcript_3628/m.10317 type:complete len:215 (-) Transcript_3628:1003-1647(-)